MAREEYHVRRKDREIKRSGELKHLIERAPFVSIAMCADGEPYIVTVNHAFDSKSGCIYFHCAKSGKKVDFLAENPRVFAQVLKDGGYVDGKCDYDYASVNIEGKAIEVNADDEKMRALELLLSKFEPNLEAEYAKKRFIKSSSFGRVSIYRIDISRLTGKRRVK